MTKLEEEIRKAIHPQTYQLDPMPEIWAAQAAAEVAKRYIEAAYDNGYNSVVYEEDGPGTSYSELKTKWLKDNGITE